jgi:hypothetical protein
MHHFQVKTQTETFIYLNYLPLLRKEFYIYTTMNSNNPLSNMNGYIPDYHYLYGRHYMYHRPKEIQVYPLRSGWYQRYDFSNVSQMSILDKKPQTVEEVIRQGYLRVPGFQDETTIIHDKRFTSKLGLDDIIQQVRERYRIYNQNIYGLEQTKCYAINDLFNREGLSGQPATPDHYTALNNHLEYLYSKQREERVNLWNDISRLKQELSESAQKYLSNHRKIEILGNEKGETI